MNLQLEINAIKKELDDLQDEYLVETIKNVLSMARSTTYSSGVKLLTIEEYRESAERSEKDITEGRIKSIELLEKESEDW
jgi:hypothetical protein